MPLFDWNMDGKKDIQDDFLEYEIFKACTEEEKEDNSSDIYYDDEDDDF